MLFFKIMAAGFAFTLGMEIALGLCIALGRVTKGVGKHETN